MSALTSAASLLPLVVAALVLSFATPARADGTYVKEGGGVVMPMQNHDVQLVWETIDITPTALFEPGSDGMLVVTVTYLFRNRSDKAIDLAMGFPVGWDTRIQYMQGEHCLARETRNPMRDFTTTVDGQAVEVRLRDAKLPFRTGCLGDDEREKHEGREERARTARIKKEGFAFNEYQVWHVSFAPRGERTVVNRYLYDTSGHIYVPEWRFVYVLRTGARWHGPIERASIRLYSKDDISIDEVKPAPYRRRALPDGTREFTWELKNFKPTADLEFKYTNNTEAARQTLYEKLLRYKLERADGRLLERIRDDVLALHGASFTDPDKRRRFTARAWYRERPEGARRAAADALLQRVEARLRSLAPR